jgi:Cu2+-containing amine oxidase
MTNIDQVAQPIPNSPEERYPAGDYPNQHAGGAGLPAWTQANRSIEDTDVVVWYTMNSHYIPRPEDWPVVRLPGSSFTLSCCTELPSTLFLSMRVKG